MDNPNLHLVYTAVDTETLTETTPTLRLCKDCRYFDPLNNAFMIVDSVCKAPESKPYRNMIHGNMRYRTVSSMRNSVSNCGPEARWFISKVKREPWWKRLLRWLGR